MSQGPRKSKKDLSNEDRALWSHIAKTVNIYDKSRLKSYSAPVRSFKPRPSTRLETPLGPSNNGFKSAGLPPMDMGRKTRRGKVLVDRKIDLHDLTQDQAYHYLRAELLRAYNGSYRCVLVVTGKGAMSERANGGGVLRRQLPHWLGSRDLRPIISRYAQAHQRHGGQGAFYVFLRRN